MARVTMKDIAEELGLSTNTVSRAFSGKKDISPDTKQLIFSTAKAMGYERNAVAQSLRTQRTHIVGLVITDNSNPYFSKLVRGVEDTLRIQGYNVILCNTDESYAKERELLSVLVSRRVDGIVITPAQSGSQDLASLVERGIPLVLAGRRFEDLDAGYVVSAEKEGAFAAVEHLIKLGHRDILYLNGPAYISSAKERMAGYLSALEAAGVPPDPHLLRVCEPRTESAYNVMRSVLLEGVHFTAVFAFSDLMMLGVVQALREADIDVPCDVSLVGFDDIEFARMLQPPLTTVRQDIYGIGSAAAKLLLDTLGGRQDRHNIVLPTELIIRGSTARVSGGVGRPRDGCPDPG